MTNAGQTEGQTRMLFILRLNVESPWNAQTSSSKKSKFKINTYKKKYKGSCSLISLHFVLMHFHFSVLLFVCIVYLFYWRIPVALWVALVFGQQLDAASDKRPLWARVLMLSLFESSHGANKRWHCGTSLIGIWNNSNISCLAAFECLGNRIHKGYHCDPCSWIHIWLFALDTLDFIPSHVLVFVRSDIKSIVNNGWKGQ